MKTGRKLFTIAIPVRNGGDFLAQALDSALAQTYLDYEIVVSDNASEDATQEILASYAARYANIRVVRAERMLTLSDNWNRAYALARGEWVKILAHDDLLYPTCLERIAEELRSLPAEWIGRCALVGTGEEWLLEGNKRWPNVITADHRRALQLDAPQYIRTQILGRAPAPLPAATTATLHKTVIPLGAPYDGRFFHSDTVLYTNLLCRYHYLYIPEVLCVNRIQKASATNTVLKGSRSVTEEIQFSREFLARYGRTLGLGAWGRLRFRLRPASAAASQISKGILRHEFGTVRGAIVATPFWQQPLLPALTLRALARDRKKLVEIGLPADVVL